MSALCHCKTNRNVNITWPNYQYKMKWMQFHKEIKGWEGGRAILPHSTGRCKCTMHHKGWWCDNWIKIDCTLHASASAHSITRDNSGRLEGCLTQLYMQVRAMVLESVMRTWVSGEPGSGEHRYKRISSFASNQLDLLHSKSSSFRKEESFFLVNATCNNCIWWMSVVSRTTN